MFEWIIKIYRPGLPQLASKSEVYVWVCLKRWMLRSYLETSSEGFSNRRSCSAGRHYKDLLQRRTVGWNLPKSRRGTLSAHWPSISFRQLKNLWLCCHKLWWKWLWAGNMAMLVKWQYGNDGERQSWNEWKTCVDTPFDRSCFLVQSWRQFRWRGGEVTKTQLNKRS